MMPGSLFRLFENTCLVGLTPAPLPDVAARSVIFSMSLTLTPSIGKPLLIGHDGPRGVVSTASYEARPFDCRSAIPMVTAKRLCPQAIVMPVRGERYREVSQQMFAILEEYSPLIEPLSIDEAFLDLTGTERALGAPIVVAKQMKDRIRRELGVTASVGVAPCKFLAKFASDMNKPDGSRRTAASKTRT